MLLKQKRELIFIFAKELIHFGFITFMVGKKITT